MASGDHGSIPWESTHALTRRPIHRETCASDGRCVVAKRVCTEPGCPTLIEAGRSRCTDHERARDKARGTAAERGYGSDYEAAKREPDYANATRCTRCGEAFTPDNPKTAGHIKAIRKHGPNNAGITPQCRRCNYGWARTDT